MQLLIVFFEFILCLFEMFCFCFYSTFDRVVYLLFIILVLIFDKMIDFSQLKQLILEIFEVSLIDPILRRYRL